MHFLSLARGTFRPSPLPPFLRQAQDRLWPGRGHKRKKGGHAFILLGAQPPFRWRGDCGHAPIAPLTPWPFGSAQGKLRAVPSALSMEEPCALMPSFCARRPHHQVASSSFLGRTPSPDLSGTIPTSISGIPLWGVKRSTPFLIPGASLNHPKERCGHTPSERSWWWRETCHSS